MAMNPVAASTPSGREGPVGSLRDQLFILLRELIFSGVVQKRGILGNTNKRNLAIA
jgi:hypothetical protein